MERVQIPLKQTPKEYLVVRVSLVHVRLSWWRKLLGLIDKQLTASAFIANTPQEAVDMTNGILGNFEKIAKEKGYKALKIDRRQQE